MSHTEHTHQKKPKKKFHSRLTKYLYERDTILATIWVFIFIFGLGMIPLNLYVLNPLKMGLKDFDYTDLAYAELEKGKNSTLDSNIVIINIGYADRKGLAFLVEKAASYNPKVIGLDVEFNSPKEDAPEKDSAFIAVASKTPNLILASRFNPGKGKKESEFHSNYFTQFSKGKEGYVNFFSEEWASVRIWNPLFKGDPKDSKSERKSFATSIVEHYDPIAYKRIMKGHKGPQLINYSRKLEKYRFLQGEQFLLEGADSSYLRGKIVLLGYVSDTPTDVVDKKFTPMNPKFAGKSIPDMDGVVVHANIISMVLENKYIKKVPSWVNLLIAVVVCWLFMSFFIHYYLENHIWFHLIAKIAQVSAIIFFAFLGVHLYDRYNLKVDMKMSLLVIIMAVDVIYFYEAFAVWMHKKFNYQTVFKPHHH
jgi:CHASE2 domain-containing sensor protein